mgnify:CR=1 FL=1
MKNILLQNINKIHTTALGINRIKKNLELKDEDVVTYCQNKIKDSNSIVTKKGKNYYVEIDNIIITINSYSYTIITSHKNRKKGNYVI